jgi:hypothetical protein
MYLNTKLNLPFKEQWLLQLALTLKISSFCSINWLTFVKFLDEPRLQRTKFKTKFEVRII